MPGFKPFSGESSETDQSYDAILDRLGDAITAARRRVRVAPSSRLVRSQQAIGRLKRADKRSVMESIAACLTEHRWDHPYRDSLLALGEARMAIEIIEGLIDHLSDQDLRDLISGSMDPATDAPSARGRDKQFELFVAAILLRSGLPVALTEPDVLFQFGDAIRSVAAKRLISRRNADRNIKKAADQILSAGHPGYIFVDITRLLDPASQFMQHWRYESETLAVALEAFCGNPVVTSRRNPLVQGAFVRVSYPMVSPGFVFGTAETVAAVAVREADTTEHGRVARLLHVGLRGT
jgi:hypothetical protein